MRYRTASAFIVRSERSRYRRGTGRVSLHCASVPLKSRHYYIAIMLSRIFPASSITPIICVSWSAGGPIICG